MRLTYLCHFTNCIGLGNRPAIRAHLPDGFFYIHPARLKHLVQPVGNSAGEITQQLKNLGYDTLPLLVYSTKMWPRTIGVLKLSIKFGLYCKLVYICIGVRTDCAAVPGPKTKLNS